jgi:hypothetical protein
MGFPDLISLSLLGVVADKMGCGGYGFAGVGMVVVGLGLGSPAWVWGLWAVAADRLPRVWLGCKKIYIKKELFYNILM